MKIRANVKEVYKLRHGSGATDKRQNLPLKNKKVFLQLHGFKGNAKFEKDIILLGGIIERCFSREVDCLITSRGRPADYEKSKKNPVSSPSPVTPSPFNLGSVGVDSPQGHSPGSGEPQKPLTRGKAMAQAAKTTKSYGSTDVIEAARSWNIKIIHIEPAQRWVAKQMEKLPAEMMEPSKKDGMPSRQLKSRRLHGSYLKFESINKHYRPVLQEFKSLPQIYFDSPPWTCPFYKKGDNMGKIDERGEGEERDPQGAAAAEIEFLVNGSPKDVMHNKKYKGKNNDGKKKRQSSEDWFGGKVLTAGEIRRMAVEKKKAEMRRGYCELCQMKYENINKHVLGDIHRKFVRNDRNYASLDNVIKLGPSVQQFIQDVREAHWKMNENDRTSTSSDKVLLLKELGNSEGGQRSSTGSRKSTQSNETQISKVASPGKTRFSRRTGALNNTPASEQMDVTQLSSPIKMSPAKRKLSTSTRRSPTKRTPNKKLLTKSKANTAAESPQRRSTRSLGKSFDSDVVNPGKEGKAKETTPAKKAVVVSGSPKKISSVKAKMKVVSPMKKTPTKNSTSKTKTDFQLEHNGNRLTRTSNKLCDVEIIEISEGNDIEEIDLNTPEGKWTEKTHIPEKFTPSKEKASKLEKRTTRNTNGGDIESPRKSSTRTSAKLSISSSSTAPVCSTKGRSATRDPPMIELRQRDGAKCAPSENEKSPNAKATTPKSGKDPPSPMVTPPSVWITNEVPSERTTKTIQRILKKIGSPRVLCERIKEKDLNQFFPVNGEASVNQAEKTEPASAIRDPPKTKRKQTESRKNLDVEKGTLLEPGKKMALNVNCLDELVESGPVRRVRSNLRRRRWNQPLPVDSDKVVSSGSTADMGAGEKKADRSDFPKPECQVDESSGRGRLPNKDKEKRPSLDGSSKVEQKTHRTPVKSRTPNKVYSPKTTPNKLLVSDSGKQGEKAGVRSSVTTPKGKSTPTHRRRSREFKLKEPWSVLSERSMVKILEEESDTEFDGFTKDSLDVKDIPSDASYCEVEGDLEASKAFTFNSITQDNSKSTDGKEIIITCGLDVESSSSRPGSTSVTPVKSLLKNMSQIMSDASSTGWDDNLDDFLEDRVKKQAQDTDSSKIGVSAGSLRKSPRKNASQSPFIFVGSPVKKSEAVQKIASPVRRSPRKSLSGSQGKSPSCLNRTWNCAKADSSLLREASNLVDLWVGPTKNERCTPSYTQKSLLRQTKSPNSSGIRSPIYQQSPLVHGQKSKSKGEHCLSVHQGRSNSNSVCQKTLDSVGSSNSKVKMRGANECRDTAPSGSEKGGVNSICVKKVDPEIQFRISSPKKQLEESLNSLYLPSPITPLERASKTGKNLPDELEGTPTSKGCLNKSRTDYETSDSDSEAPKKKLLKFSSSTKKKLCLGFASFEFTGKTITNTTPSESGVKLSSLGAAVKAPGEHFASTPRTSRLDESPVRRTCTSDKTPTTSQQSPTVALNQKRNKMSLKRRSWDTNAKATPNNSEKHLNKCPDVSLSEGKVSEKNSSSFSTPTIKKSNKLSLIKNSDFNKSSTSPLNTGNKGKSGDTSLNESGTSRPPSTTSTPRSCPIKKLDALLQLHSLDDIQVGPRRKSSNVSSIVRFSSADCSGESPEPSWDSPVQRRTPVQKITPVRRKSPQVKRSHIKAKSSSPNSLLPKSPSNSGSQRSDSVRAADSIKSKALARLRSKSAGAASSDYKNWSRNKNVDWSKPESLRSESRSNLRLASKRRPSDRQATEDDSRPRKKQKLEMPLENIEKKLSDGQRRLRKRTSNGAANNSQKKRSSMRERNQYICYSELPSEGDAL